MKIGLCGAHRVGKTSLCREVSFSLNLPNLVSSTSHIFKQKGLDPSYHLSFDKRLNIQNLILDHYIQKYNELNSFITDRTPLDLIAYTLADINNSVNSEFQPQINVYIEKCLEVLNRFDNLFLIQPGIPLIPEQGKAKCIPAYQEHLNYIMLGYIMDCKIESKIFIMPRKVLDFQDRINFITNTISSHTTGD